MSRVLALAAFVPSVLLAGVAGVLFAVARADFGNLRCDAWKPADWETMNANCADAAWLMWRAGPVAVAGLLSAGLALWGIRRA